MDSENGGKIREAYTLGDGRLPTELKGRSSSCKKITVTHSTMSSTMKDGKR
jgi:hypothetical protein